MNTLNIMLSNLSGKVIPLGYEGENLYTRVRINCIEVFSEYPNATVSMVVSPPVGDMYPALVEKSGVMVVWNITDAVLSSSGQGQAQITFTEDEVIRKSVVFGININSSLVAEGEAPSPIQEWIDNAEATAKEIAEEAAADVIEGYEQLVEDVADMKETVDDLAEVVPNLETDVTDLKTAIEQLEDPVTGSFNAGIARKIISDQYVTDKAPYVFRKAFDADFLEDKITGGTIVWNQQGNTSNFPSTGDKGNGVSVTSVDTTTGTIVVTVATGGATAAVPVLINSATLPQNHVLFLRGTQSGDGTSKYGMNLFYNSSGRGMWDYGSGVLGKPSIGDVNQIGIMFFNGCPAGTYTFRPQLFDLTAMFGSTIADYIYGLEQATAGSGLAWLKAHGFFTNAYYAYNAGTLESVQTSARKVVGFNQWDEQWEVGSIDLTTGENTASTGTIRSKNYIRLIPGKSYYVLKSGLNVGFRKYGANKEYLGYISANTTDINGIIGDDVHYIRFITNSTTVYNPSIAPICINISDSSLNGTYKPYESKTYPLDSDLVLRGIPKLDANNNLYYDGDVYEADGTVTRRYGIVDLGSLTWTAEGSGLFRSMQNTIVNSMVYGGNMICAKYLSNGNTSPSTMADKEIAVTNSQALPILRINDSGHSSDDGNTFKTAVTGTYLVYELLTPTTAEADPFATGQLCYPDGTEEYVDAGVTATTPTRDVSIPVGGGRKYYKDFRREVREMIAELQALILENI